MILCLQVERIGACLATFAPVMDRYRRGDMDFADEALKWLDQAERVMSLLRLPDGAELSSLRGRILRAADASTGEEPKPARSVLRRARNVAAAEALERAEALLHGRLRAAEDRLGLFEDKLCEGVTAFLLRNGLPDEVPERQTWLLLVWNELRRFEATRPLAIYLAASLSQPDRCYLLDRVLSRVATLDQAIPADTPGIEPLARNRPMPTSLSA